MNAKYYGYLPILVLLTACTHTPKVEDTPTGNKIIASKQNAATMTSWEIKGALAAKNNNKAWSATMNWLQQGPNTYQIRLIGPLGGGAALITKSGQKITFQEGQKTTSSTNAETLLAQQTGIRLPVNNLYYWVRGIPAPGHIQSEQRDQYKHLIQLQQNGYTIDFARYTSIDGIDLPQMIRLEGNHLMIKVIIKNWH